MFSYNMEKRGSSSLYEYLYRCIRHDIAHGKISPNKKLPSKRAAAKHLGVSLITVEAAYRQLIAEGYVRTRERSGYYVCELAPAGPETTNRYSLDANKPASRREGLRQACIATSLFPYSAWAKTMRRTLAEETSATLAQAASAAGSQQLREAIASYLHDYRGMDVHADQIIVGAGSQTLYQLIIQLLGRNRTYAIENPGYPLLTRMYELNNAPLAQIPLDANGILVDALQSSGASVAHIMPSHQFPTGTITSASRRRELLNWARAETEQESSDKASSPSARYIIEDDYDSEFRMTGKPISSLFGIDAANRVLYLNSFAKSLGEAFRIAYLVLPPQLAEEFSTNLGFYSNTVSPIDQLTLAHFISNGQYERHVNRLRTQAKQTQNIIVEALKASAINDRISFRGLNGGLHFVLNINGTRDESQIAERIAEADAPLSHLSTFQDQGMRKDETSLVVRTDAIAPDEAEIFVQQLLDALM